MTPYNFEQTLIGYFVTTHRFTDARGRTVTDLAT